jgi:hypothetical protein
MMSCDIADVLCAVTVPLCVFVLLHQGTLLFVLCCILVGLHTDLVLRLVSCGIWCCFAIYSQVCFIGRCVVV